MRLCTRPYDRTEASGLSSVFGTLRLIHPLKLGGGGKETPCLLLSLKKDSCPRDLVNTLASFRDAGMCLTSRALSATLSPEHNESQHQNAWCAYETWDLLLNILQRDCRREAEECVVVEVPSLLTNFVTRQPRMLQET